MGTNHLNSVHEYSMLDDHTATYQIEALLNQI